MKIEEKQDREYSDDVSYADAMKWVFENWPRYIRVKKAGANEYMREKEMEEKAPSLGAIGLLEYARESLDKFQALAARVLAKGSQAEVSEEAKDIICDEGVDDLKRVLQSLGEE